LGQVVNRLFVVVALAHGGRQVFGRQGAFSLFAGDGLAWGWLLCGLFIEILEMKSLHPQER